MSGSQWDGFVTLYMDYVFTGLDGQPDKDAEATGILRGYRC